MTNVRNLTDLAGRVLIAAMFLVAGLGKITGYAGTQAYMAAAGVPGALLPAVIVLEVLGGAAIMAGWHTRAVAAALALFSIVAALLFHGDSDPMQRMILLKDFAVAGGFLFLVARGPGDWSLDARRERLEAPREPVARGA